MNTKTTPIVTTPNLEGGVSVQIGPKAVKQSFTPATATTSPTHQEEGSVGDFHALTTKPLDTGMQTADQTPTAKEEQKPDSEKTPEEQLMENKNEIEKLFEILGERLDPKTKEKLMKKYINDMLHGDKEEEQGNNFEDTFAEIARLLMLLIKLFMMLLFNPDKTTFTGKDLNLDKKAPEGEGSDLLSKLLTGKSAQESWDGFVKDVDEIGKDKPVPFDVFMSLVLAANKRNSVKIYKLKNKEDVNGNLVAPKRKPGLLRRMLGFGRRKTVARGRS